jgi:hypothetical protein
MGIYEDIAKHSLPRPAPAPSPSPSSPRSSGSGDSEQTSRTVTWVFIIATAVLTFFLGYMGFIIGAVLVIILFIRNQVTFGKIMPGQGNGIGMTLIIIILIVIALFPLFAGLGLNGIISGVDALALGTKNTAEQAAQGYIQTVYQAMGMSYASEVDEHADEDIGITLRDIDTTQQYYSSSDPVTIWGVIDGKALGDRTINVSLDCWHEQRKNRLKDIIRTDGSIAPTDKFLIDEEMTNDFRCEFPQGILSGDSATANRFFIKSDFNFQTMAYLTATFLDQDAYLALRQSDPTRLATLQQSIAKNSYGPVALGIGSKEMPIIVSTNSIQTQPYIGFSLSNNWQGYINNISHISVLMPKGIEIYRCDGETDMYLDTDHSTDFFNNYTMGVDGLRYLSNKITREDGVKEFIPQNFKCFMKVNTAELFGSRGRLDPVSRNIFAYVEYSYTLEEERSVVVRSQYEDFSIVLSPSMIGLQTIVTYELQKNRFFGTVSSVSLSLKYRRSGEMDSVDVSGYQDIPVPRDANGDYEGQFMQTLSQIIPELERGDSVIFDFTIQTSTGVEKAIQSIRILNKPPSIIEAPVFNPSSPGTLDDITCSFIVEEEDGDELLEKAIIFSNRDTQETFRFEGDDVSCQLEDERYLCTATLVSEETNEGDTISCSGSFSDGIDYSIEYLESQVQIQAGTSENPEAQETTYCEDSDGGKIRTNKGTTSGINSQGNYQSLSDFCEGGNLVELYCENNILKSQKYPCECSNGVCVDE